MTADAFDTALLIGVCLGITAGLALAFGLYLLAGVEALRKRDWPKEPMVWGDD